MLAGALDHLGYVWEADADGGDGGFGDGPVVVGDGVP